MASTINATTSSGIVATADNTGNLALQSAGTTIMTVTSTGVTTQVGAPSFSAYLSTNQSITSGVFTKIQFNTEQWDTNNNYDNTTNYRFTPTVAGYYQIDARFSSTVATTLLVISLFKNGAEIARGGDNRVSQNASSGVQLSTMMLMNGTTDYLEIYGYIAGTSPAFEGGQGYAYFQGFLARSA